MFDDFSGDLKEVLDEKELYQIDAYWRAANYLTVGQIYLADNPLIDEPLRMEHIKRFVIIYHHFNNAHHYYRLLLGHWGTSPGISFKSYN
jgi:xylulose-5-phosphate/fructose-6-phosphate phosphoketolase